MPELPVDRYTRVMTEHLMQREAERHYRELLAYLKRFKNCPNKLTPNS